MNEEKIESECLTINVATAAKILGLSLGLTYEMVRQKKIPALHFGRLVRIPKFALERLLHAQHDGGESEDIVR